MNPVGVMSFREWMDEEKDSEERGQLIGWKLQL
jgi:hypothetical protein